MRASIRLTANPKQRNAILALVLLLHRAWEQVICIVALQLGELLVLRFVGVS